MDIVPGSTLRVPVDLDGRRYILRPPTFGEAGELAARQSALPPASPAVYAEALRCALETRLPAEAAAPLVAAVTAHEDADDAFTAVASTRPLEPEAEAAHAAWRIEMREAQRLLLATARRREVAEAAVADHPALVALRERRRRAEAEAAVEMLRVSLAGWTGDGLPAHAVGADGLVPADLIRTLPAGDVATLVQAAQRLWGPSQVAAGN